jgi:hypothetical protein
MFGFIEHGGRSSGIFTRENQLPGTGGGMIRTNIRAPCEIFLKLQYNATCAPVYAWSHAASSPIPRRIVGCQTAVACAERCLFKSIGSVYMNILVGARSTPCKNIRQTLHRYQPAA